MKISLKKLDFEIKEMFRIGKLIGTDKITDADVNFLLKQATDGVPVSEFQYGLYLLLNLKKKEEAIVYFKKFLKHANGYGLWEASGRFAKLFDDLIDYDWYE